MAREVIYKALNVEKNERKIVIVLILQSIFLGIYFGAFDISAHTLFLTEFGESEIPKAYIISGAIGIAFTAIYTFLQNKIAFSKLISFTLLIAVAIPFLLRANFADQEDSASDLVFLIFILFGPVNIIAYYVAFWGMAGRLFTLRQGKRLFGLIGSGQIFGVILTSYTIPLLPSWIQTEDLLLLCGFSALFAYFVQFYISSNFNINRKSSGEQVVQKETSKLGFKHFYQDVYIRTMVIFVVLSVLITFFISYTFLAVANDNYPNEDALKDFLSYFTGTLMIFGFLIKTFIYSKLMKNYGLKVTLLILPLILFTFGGLSVLAGSFLSYKTDGSVLFGSGVASQFLFYFIAVSLSRLFSVSLRDSIEVPAFKTLYQSLAQNIRYDVQAKIDGTVNEIAAFLSGVILLGVSFILGGEAIYYSYIILGLLIIWIVITFRINTEYKKSLEKSLKSKEGDTESILFKKGYYQETLLRTIQNKEDFGMYKYFILEIIDPLEFRNEIVSIKNSETELEQKCFFDKVNRGFYYEHIAYVLKTKYYAEKNAYQKDFTNLKHGAKIYRTLSEKPSLIAETVRSDDSHIRKATAFAIGQLRDDKYYPYLQLLLRDYDYDVVKVALQAAAYSQSSDFVSPAIGMLLSDKFYAYAKSALIEIGEPALERLQQSYYKTNIKLKHQLRLIHAIGAIGGDKAITILLKKMQDINRFVVKTVVDYLIFNNYTVKESEQWLFVQTIRKSVEIIAWNINVIFHLKKIEKADTLLKAISKDNDFEKDFLFAILSVTYDKNMIDAVKENLDIGTSESISYAVELLDLFVSEELKNLLFILFEDLPDNDRIRRFREHFPLMEYENDELFHKVISRDSNYISDWTKACAINLLSSRKMLEPDKALIAQMFNSEALLHQLAGKVVLEFSSEIFENTILRIKEPIKSSIIDCVDMTKAVKSEYEYDKMQFLLNVPYFKDLSSNTLLVISRMMNLVNISDYDEFFNAPDVPIVFIVKGEMNVWKNEKKQFHFGENSFVDISVCDLSSGLFVRTSEISKVYIVERKKFNELLFDNHMIIDVLLNSYKLSKVSR